MNRKYVHISYNVPSDMICIDHLVTQLSSIITTSHTISMLIEKMSCSAIEQTEYKIGEIVQII